MSKAEAHTLDSTPEDTQPLNLPDGMEKEKIRNSCELAIERENNMAKYAEAILARL